MSIIKHTSHKSPVIGKAVDYYTLKHVKLPKGCLHIPVRDLNGNKQVRSECRTYYVDADGMDAPLERWITDCNFTARRFGKNWGRDEVKTHEYIISFPEADRPKLDWARLEWIGRRFAARYCEGHSTLISIHRDKLHDHIHVCCYSLRAKARKSAGWMLRSKETGKILNCETAAGFKYQDSNALHRDQNDWMLTICRQFELTLEDNNKIADDRRAEKYEGKHADLRKACLDCAKRSRSLEGLQLQLEVRYGIQLIIRGNTLSVLPKDRKKAIRLDRLGLEPSDLFPVSQPNVYEPYQFELEKKRYIQWLQLRREKNEAYFSKVFAQTIRTLNEKHSLVGSSAEKKDFAEFTYLIQQCLRVEDSLMIEMAKIDRLLERWEKYLDSKTDPEEKRKHASYVRWCGCKPWDRAGFCELIAGRKGIEAQLRMMVSMRKAMESTSEYWNNCKLLDGVARDKDWERLDRNKLRQELKYIKENRRQLHEIMLRCEMAARRRFPCSIQKAGQYFEERGVWPQGWEKYGLMREKYREMLVKERLVKQRAARKREEEMEWRRNRFKKTTVN